MRKSPEELEKMNDYEINMAVAQKHFNASHLKIAAPKYNVDTKTHPRPPATLIKCVCLLFPCGAETVFDPCSEWNDIMPIVEKLGIFYCPGKGESRHHYAVTGVVGDGIISYNENGKRAICEVFLMM